MSEKLVPDFNFEVDSPNDDSLFAPPAQEGSPPKDNEQPRQYAKEADQNVIAAYQYYLDNGYLSGEYEDFDGTPDSLQAVLAAEREAEAEHIFNSLVERSPEFAKPLIELVLTKGQDLTLEEAANIFNYVKPSEYTADSFKDGAIAEKYLKEYYMKEFGDTADEAEDRIDLLKDKNKLEKEATTLFGKEQAIKQKAVSNAIEQAKENAALRQQQEAAYNQAFAAGLQGWRSDTQKRVQAEFYNGQFKQRMEHILQNPTALAKLVHFMSYYNGEDIDMANFSKEADTPANKRKKENLQNYWSQNFRSSKVDEDDSGDFNINDFEIEL